MIQSQRFSLFWLWLALTISPTLMAADLKLGVLTVSEVKGAASATKLDDGSTTALQVGDKITQGFRIATAPGASLVLVLSNGTVMVVAEKTTVSVTEFLIDPFDPAAMQTETSTEEASVSSTRLDLAEGGLNIRNRKLRLSEGSKFEVHTKLGVAGVRGSEWSIFLQGLALYLSVNYGGVNLESGGVSLLVEGNQIAVTRDGAAPVYIQLTDLPADVQAAMPTDAIPEEGEIREFLETLGLTSDAVQITRTEGGFEIIFPPLAVEDPPSTTPAQGQPATGHDGDSTDTRAE